VNINRKTIGFLTSGFFIVSIIVTYSSVSALKKSQTDNIKLFKDEFLELGREFFDSRYNSFFNNLEADVRANMPGQKEDQLIFDYIKRIDPNGDNVVIVGLDSKQFLYGYNNSNLTSIFDQVTTQNWLDKYIRENKLNQKTDFDLDNFQEFSVDTTHTIIPKKIHFRVYPDSGVMIGFGQDFASGKVRIEFIERQNEILFNSQMYSLIIIFLLVVVLSIILMILFMRRTVLLPLSKIVEVVKQIAAGDLTKKVEIESKDEIGELGLAFNEMTSKLKNSYGILESKIEERTRELQNEQNSLEKKVEERTSELEGLKTNLQKTVEERTHDLNAKVLELERMNELMLGRELKMVELKNEIKKLKEKKK
jgi:Signal transduction histidine kinase, nitrate/nitrite-specific